MLGRVVLDRYEVVESIGHGSMGQVWLARDRRQKQDVVVKVMHERIAKDPKFRDLFQREMEFMQRFRHPHAVRFIDATLDDPNGPCIVMEYVPGVGLDQILEQHKVLHPERVGALLIQICQALNAAHQSGIIHRDLKPANLMVIHPDHPDEFLKVMDLGLARLTAKPYIPIEKLQGSADHHAVGTPAYCCPEQLRGDQIDHRSDIYSLGVILFELLTGRLPFEDESSLDVMHAQMHRAPPRFADVGVKTVGRAVEQVVQLCLSKYPIERPQTAYDLANRFHRALARATDLSERDFQSEALPNLEASGLPMPGRNADRIVEVLEAWMPEPIALVKLRGFVEDAGGRVVESRPGLIKVTFGEPPPEPPAKPKGLFAFLRKTPLPDPQAPPPLAPVAIDLYMRKIDPQRPNQLSVAVVFRALSGALPFDSRWHDRCDRLLGDLRGYLMAQR
jgi:serine/threonine-protein kinase